MAEVTGYEAGTPAWVDLITSDPEAARTFYGPLFGWEFDIGPAERGFYTMCLRGGRIAAGMVGIPVENIPTVWMTYMATGGADETGQRLTEAGGAVSMGPVDAGDQGRVVVGTDPQGVSIGAWEARAHIGASVVNEPGSVVWNELRTSDLEAATAFYSKVFGYSWEPTDTGQGGPDYRTFSANGQLAGGALQADADQPAASHWLIYFAVEDLDAATALLQDLGGAVSVAATDSPFGRWSVVQDPQGGVFAILQPPGSP